MRTIDYIKVLSTTADLCGLDRDNLSSHEFKKIRDAHNNRLASAYEWCEWPELIYCEKRYLRADYNSATTYSTGDVVYYSSTDKYYQASQAATNILPTVTTHWAVVTRADFNPYISLTQAGKTEMGTVFGLYDKDPARYETLEAFDWHLSNNGIQVTDNKTFAWVEFRVRAPEIDGDSWSQSSTYSVGDQVYFSNSSTPGNFYNCTAATSSGESPATTPSKWTVVQIPYIFGRYLAHAGYADYLTSDQQSERKANEELFATELLTNQVTLVAGQQGQYRRVAVLTR